MASTPQCARRADPDECTPSPCRCAGERIDGGVPQVGDDAEQRRHAASRVGEIGIARDDGIGNMDYRGEARSRPRSAVLSASKSSQKDGIIDIEEQTRTRRRSRRSCQRKETPLRRNGIGW